jgi:predicted O-methyltransferase YrrM
MLSFVRSAVKAISQRLLPETGLSLSWTKRAPDSWLVQHLPFNAIKLSDNKRFRQFEQIAAQINSRGAQPLWEGYKATYQKDANVPWAGAAMERLPDQVRTQPQMGRLFSMIAEQYRPGLIVEIGTAFGVSAMYWADGLQLSGQGRLLTFEPNSIWHAAAVDHLQTFGNVVMPILGTFEDNVDAHAAGEPIALAFVDAIHTSQFVDAQITMILERAAPHSIIVMDDITFSDDMRSCWARWAGEDNVRSSVAVDQRVGILEF